MTPWPMIVAIVCLVNKRRDIMLYFQRLLIFTTSLFLASFAFGQPISECDGVDVPKWLGDYGIGET